MIVVVPARGGSKGIYRKNLRLLNGKPLLFYALKMLECCDFISVIIVTSDDNEIISYAQLFNKVVIRKRPSELGNDDVSLDPVIQDAIFWYESEINYQLPVDPVITVQPTSPLLSETTFSKAIKYYLESKIDCLISAVNDTHLRWTCINNNYVPCYKERVNRQWLPKSLKETGSFLISTRKALENCKRITGTVKLFEIPENEAFDIDTDQDWLICSAILKRLTIDFVVTGNERVGFGHVRRALTLADYWLGHDINFICYNTTKIFEEIISNRKYKIVKAYSEEDIGMNIRDRAIVINDILDTSRSYISSLKSRNSFIVNFEDLGDGSVFSNLVINALYENYSPMMNSKYGLEYECLDERFLSMPSNSYKAQLENILITFGGSDPANLTLKTLKALLLLTHKFKFNVRVVIGPAYNHKSDLICYVHDKRSSFKIQVLSSVNNMAEVMRDVDLAITSNGRTVYELAAMKIPLISMAQNNRETMHMFAQQSKGVRYLGLGEILKPADIAKEINKIMEQSSLRKEMYDNLPANRLRSGIFRVTDLIEEEYRRWLNEKNYD